MKPAIKAFRLNAERVQHLGGLHDAISGLMTSALDASDLLRAQVVLAVSALDHYIHEATVEGMLEVFDGTRLPTAAFKKNKISAGLLITSAAASRSAFEADIRERHSFLSFQQPEKIADAVRLFYDRPLWSQLAVHLSKSEEDIKTHLRLIIDRRNKIAHEADVDPSFPGARWPISRQDADDSIKFISSLCETINLVTS